MAKSKKKNGTKKSNGAGKKVGKGAAKKAAASDKKVAKRNARIDKKIKALLKKGDRIADKIETLEAKKQ
jgi:hypothetical protein